MCGVGTEVIAGEGLILTAGGFDAHIHFTCPQLAEEAIASGLTTMVGGGTGREQVISPVLIWSVFEQGWPSRGQWCRL